MLYIKWIATEAYETKQLETTISPDDVCDVICHEISEIKDLLAECELALRQWSMERYGKIAQEIEESLLEEDDDPNYQPSEEEGNDTDNSDWEDRSLAALKSRPSLAQHPPGSALVFSLVV